MGNLLPTITVLLAELTALLLVAFGVVLYLYARRRSPLEADLSVAQLSPSPAARGPSPAQDGAASTLEESEAIDPESPAQSGIEVKELYPDEAVSHGAPAAIDPALGSEVTELREKVERLSDQMAQLRHEGNMTSKELSRMMENERSDVVHVQRETVQVRKEMEKLAEIVEQIKEQQERLNKDVKRLHQEMDLISNEYAAAYSNSQHTVVKAAPKRTAAASPGVVRKPTPAIETNPDPDLALPDAALDLLGSETPETPASPSAKAEPKPAASSIARAADSGDSEPDDSMAAAALENETGTSNASAPADSDNDDQPSPSPDTPGAGADAERADEDAAGKSAPADASTLERLFGVANFKIDDGKVGINVEEINLDELNIQDPHGIDATAQGPAKFELERVFYQSSTEKMAQGWYFALRGGQVHGPFGSKDAATRVLDKMIEQFKQAGDSGGR